MKNISKPIISNGNFKFVKNEGVYFETTYPIKSTVSYTNKDYKQINYRWFSNTFSRRKNKFNNNIK